MRYANQTGTGSLKDSTLEQITDEILSRYAGKGPLAGMSVIITDDEIQVSRNATKPALLELAKKLHILATYGDEPEGTI